MTPPSASTTVTLAPHHLGLVLFQPQIAPNTGNIGRLCAATATALHLIRPLGFALDDRNLRRSGMDYWKRLTLTVHDDSAAFFAAMANRPIWFFSTKGQQALWDITFQNGDLLAFGNETHGLDASILAAHSHRLVRIPQAAEERCLNLSTAAGVVLYEALRQIASSSPSAGWR